MPRGWQWVQAAWTGDYRESERRALVVGLWCFSPAFVGWVGAPWTRSTPVGFCSAGDSPPDFCLTPCSGLLFCLWAVRNTAVKM